MRKSFRIIVVAFILTIILINNFISSPVFKTLEEKFHFEQAANQPEAAEQTIWQMVQQDSLNIKLHYAYINAHFDIPERKKVGKNSYVDRDDLSITQYYTQLADNDNPTLADIGRYGSGLLLVWKDEYMQAYDKFLEVNNQSLLYLHNSLGNVLLHFDSLATAENEFKQEIALNGNLEGAYNNLSQVYLNQAREAEFESLLLNPVSKEYIPLRLAQQYYFLKGNYVNYFKLVLKGISYNYNIWGIIAALLIAGSWIMYLEKIDVFEPEKVKHVFITVLLGGVFSFLVYPMSLFNNLILGYHLNGALLNDFLYCVLGIGAIEELVKIIPLLLMLRFTKAINEPFDYIKYASLSAIGFAFAENMLYFSDSNLGIIHGRALTAAVSHMFDSSLIAYGMVLNKFKYKRNSMLNFALFFALASIAHGFYDFWLINQTASTFSIITFAFLISSVFMWSSFKNNALNQSVFYDNAKFIDNQKLQDYLFFTLSSVLLYEYIALAFRYSPQVANQGLVSSLTSGTYLLFFITNRLSQFNLVKGEWGNIKYWHTNDEETINYQHPLGKRVKLEAYTQNKYSSVFMPNEGVINNYIQVGNKPGWYVVQLNRKVSYSGYLGDTVVIRCKNQDELPEEGISKLAACMLVPNGVELVSEMLRQRDLTYCGWITIS